MKVSTIKISFYNNKIEIERSLDLKSDDDLGRKSIEMELNVAKIFHKVLNKGRIIEIFEKKDYELLGEMLYKILTATTKVRDFFHRLLSEVIRDKDDRCLFYFEFLGDNNEFASLPWEYLYIPYDQDRKIGPMFIGAESRHQFNLFRILKSKFHFQEYFDPDERKEINVVVLYVNATDKPINRLGLENNFKTLVANNTVVNDDGSRVSRFIAHAIENPTRRNIAEKISEKLRIIDGPYVLHFMGHAEMRKEGCFVGLADQQGQVDFWSAESFIEIFDQQRKNYLRHPSMVFLQACESGQIDDMGNGLGVGLVKQGISPVIAMQNEITEDVSNAFVQRIYQWMMDGDDIFYAVSKGRHYLGCEYSKDSEIGFKSYNTNFFGTPVVFTNRASDPLRLMPKTKNMRTGEKEAVIKRCSRCTQEYVNTKDTRCGKNFCNGELIIVQASTLAISDSMASTSTRHGDGTRASSSASSK